MTPEASQQISVLCVDDNPDVADALRLKLSRMTGFTWVGTLSSADTLIDTVQRLRPSIVLLDLDMPGADPFVAAAEVAQAVPDSRIVVFSGHVRPDLITKALEAGAWGYISKNDGEDELIAHLRQVAAGNISLSSGVRAMYNRA
jgi:DNA-binding NarL/FixJ family response regulator